MKLPWIGANQSAKKTYAGLWITQDTIAIAKVTREGQERPKLRSCDYRQFTTQEDIPQILQEFCNSYYLLGKPIMGVLNPSQYQLFLIDSPDIEEHHLADAIQWRVKDLVEYPIQEACLDAMPMPNLPNQPPDKEKMAYVVVSRKKTVDEFADLVEGHDLLLQSLDIPETVVRYALMFCSDLQPHMAFLNIMPHMIQLNFMQDLNVYMTRSMEMSLWAFLAGETGQMPKELGNTEEGTAGWDWNNAQKTGISNLDDLGVEIQRSFDYCMTEYRQEPIRQLYISPMGEYGQLLTDFLSRYLGIETKMLNPETFLDYKTNFPMPVQLQSFMAICAALRGVL